MSIFGNVDWSVAGAVERFDVVVLVRFVFVQEVILEYFGTVRSYSVLKISCIKGTVSPDY
jgi:hypothetical protein